MIGMVKKDLAILLQNSKTLVMIIGIYIIFGYTNDTDLSFIIPFMATMIMTSTFSYDDFNKFHAYAATLPNGRKNVVLGKYITTLIVMICGTILEIVLSLIIGNIKGNLSMERILSSLGGSLFAIVLFISIIYPLFFKFGAEKGRIAIFVLTFGIFAIVSLLPNIVKLNNMNKLLNILDSYGVIILILFSIIFITISYFISKKLYLKREF